MEREKIVREFYKLRIFLNKSNKVADLNTKTKFEIEKLSEFEYRIVCTIYGSGENNKIILAIRNSQRIWERGGFTEFKNFEVFVAKVASEVEPEFNSEKLVPLPKTILADISAVLTKRIESYISFRPD